MKKIISALLSLGLILSLCACGDEKKDDSKDKGSANSESSEADVNEGDSGEYQIPEGEWAQFLIDNEWYADDNSASIAFSADGRFSYFITSVDEGSTTNELDSEGHWRIDEDSELELTFENGEVEYCGTQGTSFYVGHFDKTFTNGEIDPEILASWYGTYIGEEAQITISESVVDGYLSFAFSSALVAYGGDLKLHATGDVASDSHIDITLNGDTVTLDAFDSELDDYVGDYTKE